MCQIICFRQLPCQFPFIGQCPVRWLRPTTPHVCHSEEAQRADVGISCIAERYRSVFVNIENFRYSMLIRSVLIQTGELEIATALRASQ